ncbi:MAG TPA: pyridoxal-phosphate dependent enzyme, partial [Beijerinckiaceae bacterium]|nr:pyridoxal-phosphate dependent enzyme [Beijerinckiaceae bacterium]
EEVRAAGGRPRIVQLTGATAAPAIQAAAGEGAHAVVVACGSGLTLAGLALGFKRLRREVRLIGISVQQPAARLRPWIVEAAGQAAALAGIAERLSPDDFVLLDDQIGPGYGLPSPAGIEAVRLAGRTEALVLDPVYTGKALAGLAAARSAGVIGPGETVTFLHSGGTPGLFANAAAFA